jgi:hypothetical protein
LTDIAASSNDLTNYNKGTTSSPSQAGLDIIYPNSPQIFTLTKPSIAPLLSQTGSSASNQGIVKNFDLLPKLEECGNAPAIEGSDRIIGGTNASHGAYPWMARVGYRSNYLEFSKANDKNAEWFFIQL